MNNKIIIFPLVLLLSCGSVSGTRNDGQEQKCIPVTPTENLTPYIGKCIKIKGKVNETGYASVADYWISVPELEKYRGQKVNLKGTLLTRKEGSSGGSDQGSERGVYFIKVISIEAER